MKRHCAIQSKVKPTFAVFAQYPECEVLARTESGWVCGAKRQSASGSDYASFRGVPYAKQPLGELRFQVIEALEFYMLCRNNYFGIF